MAPFPSRKPIILKEGSQAQTLLREMETLRDKLPEDARYQIENDMRPVKAGLTGESRVMFELKNSFMEMFVLQDLRLEYDGLTAQIDFLVLTPQRSFVIECKNLTGRIETNSHGEFIRILEDGTREGIYSPITQNQRHLELIRALGANGPEPLAHLVATSTFDDVYRSLIVLANPKTILHDADAIPDMRKMVIRGDQLIGTLQHLNEEEGPGQKAVSSEAVREVAEWFLSQHVPLKASYLAKYHRIINGNFPIEREGSGGVSEEGASSVAPSAMDSTANADTLSTIDSTANSDKPGGTADDLPLLCPECGAPMVKRTATKGPRADKPFYGCSNYPKCKGIVNLGK